MTVTISAVITSHDPLRAAKLRNAVASAIAAGANEVVVVRTYGGLIEGFEGRYRDILTTAQTSGGKHAVGVEVAQGDVIAFLDDDDTWKTEKVAIVRNWFAHDDVMLLNHSFDIVDDQGVFLAHGKPDERGRWALSSNIVVRRSWAMEHYLLLRETDWLNDMTWLFLADVYAPNGAFYIDLPLTKWGYHADNISRPHQQSASAFRVANARLYSRWASAERVLVRYARSRGIPKTSELFRFHLRRMFEFRFLAALENADHPRHAALDFARRAGGRVSLRVLAVVAVVLPLAARYLLFRFNRYRKEDTHVLGGKP